MTEQHEHEQTPQPDQHDQQDDQQLTPEQQKEKERLERKKAFLQQFRIGGKKK